MPNPRFALLAVGTKGLSLAIDIAEIHAPSVVVTYEPRGTNEPGPSDYVGALEGFGVPVISDRRPDLDRLAEQHGFEVVLTVGWQYLFVEPPNVPLVILHDSNLPRLRGFAPTVTALIEGETELAVTALLAAPDIDAGDILSQHFAAFTPPIRISTAFDLLRPCYLACSLDVIDRLRAGPLVGTPQDHTLATYSIWRDAQDYRLDLTTDAARVVRTVLALGDPYAGATALLDGQEVRILDARQEPEVAFVQRVPGKVWRNDDGRPVVVCGRGMVRFDDVRDRDGRPVRLNGLRHRFT